MSHDGNADDRREKERLAAHSILGIKMPKTKKQRAAIERIARNQHNRRRAYLAKDKEAEGTPRGWYARIEAKKTCACSGCATGKPCAACLKKQEGMK